MYLDSMEKYVWWKHRKYVNGIITGNLVEAVAAQHRYYGYVIVGAGKEMVVESR